MTTPPNPGSPEAVAIGCTCPVLDNAHGRGHLCDGWHCGWWINAGCPVHDTDRLPEQTPTDETEQR